MAGDDSRQGSEKPSEQRGGTTPGGAEARREHPSVKRLSDLLDRLHED